MASVARLENRAWSLSAGDFFGAAFESFPQGLALIEGGNILYANPAFAHLLGCSREELAGAAIAGVLPVLPQEDGGAAHAFPVISDPQRTLEISSSSVTWRERRLQVLALRVPTDPRRTRELEESRDRDIALRITRRLAGDLSGLLSAITESSDVLAEALEVGRRPRLHAEKIRAASRKSEALVRQLLAIVCPETQHTEALSFTRTSASETAAPQIPDPSSPHVREVKKR